MTQSSDVRWLSMFSTSSRNLEYEIDRLDVPKFRDGVFKAALLDKDKILFISSAISLSDAHIISTSELISAPKRSPKSPDFVGEHVEPIEFSGHQPERYKVAGWWKSIKSGENVGAKYLCLALTPF